MEIAVRESGGNVIDMPGIKRGRGRPAGSRNKVSKDARELLAKSGPGAIRMLCRLAAGNAVYAVDATGKRVKQSPSLDQRIAAAKIVVDRLVPTLKATELSGAVASPIIESEEHDGKSQAEKDRHLARAILFTLAKAGEGFPGDSQSAADAIGAVSAIQGLTRAGKRSSARF